MIDQHYLNQFSIICHSSLSEISDYQSFYSSCIEWFLVSVFCRRCWSLLFNRVVALKACNFIKKRFQNRCFPVNIAKFLRMYYPRPLAPISPALGRQNIARTNLWTKHMNYSRLYLFKIKILYLFKIVKQLFRKVKLWCPK